MPSRAYLIIVLGLFACAEDDAPGLCEGEHEAGNVDGTCTCDPGYYWAYPGCKPITSSPRYSCCQCLDRTHEYQSTDSCLHIPPDTCSSGMSFSSQCYCWQQCQTECADMYPDNC